MYLTKEKALEEHRKMWKAMKEELGDCPDWDARCDFKADWCRRNFKYEDIEADCFLCEYARRMFHDGGDCGATKCDYCPIDWKAKTRGVYYCYEGGGVNYRFSPIDDILNLKEV